MYEYANVPLGFWYYLFMFEYILKLSCETHLHIHNRTCAHEQLR